ncbi:MAG: hypothetical protein HIU84_05970, partial [Acidobacteria bacterium]|nr:hypothetical protein [Acidobacteriota bacterium]
MTRFQRGAVSTLRARVARSALLLGAIALVAPLFPSIGQAAPTSRVGVGVAPTSQCPWIAE